MHFEIFRSAGSCSKPVYLHVAFNTQHRYGSPTLQWNLCVFFIVMTLSARVDVCEFMIALLFVVLYLYLLLRRSISDHYLRSCGYVTCSRSQRTATGGLEPGTSRPKVLGFTTAPVRQLFTFVLVLLVSTGIFHICDFAIEAHIMLNFNVNSCVEKEYRTQYLLNFRESKK